MGKLIIIILLAVSSLYASAQNNLTIVVKGMDETKGNMSIGLYNSDEYFPEVGKAFKDVSQQIEGTDFTYLFKDVPDGIYAVAIFQDLNKNVKQDKNFIGIPSEPYGFSNDAKATFGPPDFDKASFTINSDKTITITLKN